VARPACDARATLHSPACFVRCLYFVIDPGGRGGKGGKKKGTITATDLGLVLTKRNSLQSTIFASRTGQRGGGGGKKKRRRGGIRTFRIESHLREETRSPCLLSLSNRWKEGKGKKKKEGTGRWGQTLSYGRSSAREIYGIVIYFTLASTAWRKGKKKKRGNRTVRCARRRRLRAPSVPTLANLGRASPAEREKKEKGEGEKGETVVGVAVILASRHAGGRRRLGS